MSATGGLVPGSSGTPARLFRDTTQSAQNYGTAVAPAANTDIAIVGGLVAGVYEVTAIASYGGTADVADNMRIKLNGGAQLTLPVTPVANGQPIPLMVVLNVPANGTVTIANIAAGAVGAVYKATLVCRQVS